jgi:hypothetical protein
MGISYPGTPPGTGFDTGTSTTAFSVPSEPEGTPLSESGTSNRDHPQLHEDINLAVMALETHASQFTHDHSGDTTTPQAVIHGAKLVQANTHQSADTDTATTAIHHTLGTGAFQAAAGNHNHEYASLLHPPYIICTSLTHPLSPFPGMQIFETDTNFLRIWANVGEGYAWQLIPFLQIPQVQVQQSAPQQLHTPGWIELLWDDIVNDTANFFNSAVNAAGLIVNEAGTYATNLAVQFDPAIAPDVAQVALFVNNQISSIQSNVFQRGESYVPGFSQTVAAQGPINLNNGDVVTGAVSYVASQGLGVVNTFVNQAQNLTSRIGLTFMGK